MKSALVIGGGFAGVVSAHQLMLMGGWDVTLVESAPFLGAGNRTMYYGGHPHTFGPRHFLTTFPQTFEYLNRYVPLRRCPDHEFLTYVQRDETFYGYPIHVNDIEKMPERDQIRRELSDINIAALRALDPVELASLDKAGVARLNNAASAANFEEYWIRSVGRTLYDKFVDRYSRKMWMIDDNKAIDDFTWSPKGVTIKEGPRAAWDSAISAYPIAFNGYDDIFRIGTEGVRVLLSTRIERYDIPRKTVVVEGEERRFDVIVSTISPDILFDYCYGELPYIGRDLQLLVLPVEFALPEHVYFVYYAGDEPYTRVVEYKKFTRHKAATTLISIEIPSLRNKHYPLPFESEKRRAKRYFDEMPDGVFSIGRAGSYLYNVDIDDTILHAFKVAEAVRS
ncbi:MAG: FAD-dependent oxidoreductase [Alphaproteobacteria bacterium]|nr:FAD-dependent oxidoreductase [Alphaproteobacteria bacterium]